MTLMDARALARFEAKYEIDLVTGCWVWMAAVQPNGYGRFFDGVNVRFSHRVSYAHFVGEIPDGLVIDHLCRNRACCNPSHLRAVTTRDNLTAPGALTWTKELSERTECPRSHSLTAPNLVAAQLRKGQRECRSCYNAAQRLRRASAHGVALDLKTVSDALYVELLAVAA